MRGYRYLADCLKALAHPVRLQILEVLQSEGEACVCHLEVRLGKRQAYISQHLAKLREVGLVQDRREGLNVFYANTREGIGPFIRDAKSLAVEGARADGRKLTFASLPPFSPERCSCPKCEPKATQEAPEEN
jgi:ArsR family transcriptional regulator